VTDLPAEDAKIVTLARAARARAGASAGAALRDTDGRTYSAASVALPSLSLTALRLAVAVAASSGAPGLEAVATDDEPSESDLQAVRDLGGPDVPVIVVDRRGQVTATLRT
jgi:hypothetical protein